MSAPEFFLYTWTLPAGHETSVATIKVRAETPDKARLAIKNEIQKLKYLYNSIDLRSIGDPYGRESAESLKSDTAYKLRIMASVAFGVPVSTPVDDQIKNPLLWEGISKVLTSIEPAAEPTFKPTCSWDREPTIVHWVRA